MIKKHLFAIVPFVLLSLMVLSCKKDVNQPEIDHGLIEAYVLDNGLAGDYTSSGLFYVIAEPGTADHPTINSTVTVSYKGQTLESVVFDEGDFITLDLLCVIAGWQEGLQLVGEGGKIKLVVPSGLAYGSEGAGSIKPNEVLVFDITLHYF